MSPTCSCSRPAASDRHHDATVLAERRQRSRIGAGIDPGRVDLPVRLRRAPPDGGAHLWPSSASSAWSSCSGSVRGVRRRLVHVGDGEFLTLLGPSGCGKSTTLAAIAGLDRSDEGRIVLGEHVCFDGAAGCSCRPKARARDGVPVLRALAAHDRVGEPGVPAASSQRCRARSGRERVAEALALVGLDGWSSATRPLVRRPAAAGGAGAGAGLSTRACCCWTNRCQPGRQAARAVRAELAAPPAASLACHHDLRDPRSERGAGTLRPHRGDERRQDRQLADPHTIYERPADPFVADFIGSSNFLPGVVAEGGGETVRVKLTGFADMPPLLAPTARVLQTGDAVTVAVRPDGSASAPLQMAPTTPIVSRWWKARFGRAQPDPGACWNAGVPR